MRFKKDLTGNSDRVRAYLKYYEKYEGKPLSLSGVFTFTRSWSKKNGTPVPDYFTIDYLNKIVAAEGKEIPEFVVKWLSYYLETTPERMTEFTPENEIKSIVQDRKIAAAQAKSAESTLLELWAQIPDYEKLEAINGIKSSFTYYIDKAKNNELEVLKSLCTPTGVVIAFPAIKKAALATAIVKADRH